MSRLDQKKNNWLDEFRRRHGRPLRVLHIGNIANNAYLNAKILRRAGVECDVLCYDYYHVMSTPEWEELEDVSYVGSDNDPKLKGAEFRKYHRPEWFVQGSLPNCFAYIEAKQKNKTWQKKVLRYFALSSRRPRFAQNLISSVVLCRMGHAISVRQKIWAIVTQRAVALKRVLTTIRRNLYFRRRKKETQFGTLKIMWCGALLLAPAMRRKLITALCILKKNNFFLSRKYNPNFRKKSAQTSNRKKKKREEFLWFERRAIDISDTYKKLFHDRHEKLISQEMMPWNVSAHILRRILFHYDIVQAYSTDPIFPMMVGKRPYVAYEHGTLRDFTRGNSVINKMTSLAYRLSDHTFITNGDCVEIAEQLGIESWSTTVHPIDISRHRKVNEVEIMQLRRKHGGEIILFCPLRHDWAVKGTDVHLRAMPLIKRTIKADIKLILVTWGAELDRSRRLIRDLGYEDCVDWIPPCNRASMIAYIHASDVILDQMALPHFGATAPQALSSGTPVIMSYRPESTERIVAQPAPILSAFSPEDVANQITKTLDIQWRHDFERRARDWVDKYHSEQRIIRDHLDVYKKVLGSAYE